MSAPSAGAAERAGAPSSPAAASSGSSASASSAAGTGQAATGGVGAAAASAGAAAGGGGGSNPLAAGSGAKAGSAAGSAAGATAQSSSALTLELVDGEDLGDGFFAFPESARPPMNQSPPFRWSGGPAAKSYALVFRDVTNATPPVKWVLWNIPPERKEIPANVSGMSAMPSEVPGASQLGSLGNQGYAGPCCVGNKYEWIVYALDVAELPGTQGLSTAQINMNVLPMHTLEKSKPLMLRIK